MEPWLGFQAPKESLFWGPWWDNNLKASSFCFQKPGFVGGEKEGNNATTKKDLCFLTNQSWQPKHRIYSNRSIDAGYQDCFSWAWKTVVLMQDIKTVFLEHGKEKLRQSVGRRSRETGSSTPSQEPELPGRRQQKPWALSPGKGLSFGLTQQHLNPTGKNPCIAVSTPKRGNRGSLLSAV